ncbi:MULTISPECIES: DUF6124 family protein [Pseudomonas]|uniref:DUF3077 domain-containing protein n=1 Tax=Pseudomonas folii TaxID=2762593 RepID=A0ABR7B688_9PSED|nr:MULTISPECIES: hypothetical protein [Pseudomonas]MBC3952674.1 hypothetical protein [Pseudomonas folii]PHN26489.1 hypothetical protein AO242_26710 [Pseudomonas sp. ICMP 561]
MIKSAPNFSLFTVKPDVSVNDALVLACEYLTCAAATAYESADNHTPEFRALARSVVHQLEAARALVEASVMGLEGQRKAI